MGITYVIQINNNDIIKAYNKHRNEVKHTDAPTELDLVMIRENLPQRHKRMISLHWLRNKVVGLRKANKLMKQEKISE